MKLTIKFFQTLAIALAISFTLLSIPGMTSPSVADVPDDCIKIEPRTHGMVSGIQVSNMTEAIDFYRNTLKMRCLSNFYNPSLGWVEFYDPGNPNVSIGLSESVTSIIVPDLALACKSLTLKGIPITESHYSGDDYEVCVAYFQDPDGNTFAYRQEKWPDENVKARCEKIVADQCAITAVAEGCGHK